MVRRQEFSRGDRVRKALIREISDIIQNEVKDPRLADQVISVTDVELSNDLRHAKVFLSILADADQQNELMTILLESKSQVRQQVGRRVRMRYTPEIEFFLDDSLERGSRVSALLDQISRGEL